MRFVVPDKVLRPRAYMSCTRDHSPDTWTDVGRDKGARWVLPPAGQTATMQFRTTDATATVVRNKRVTDQTMPMDDT